MNPIRMQRQMPDAPSSVDPSSVASASMQMPRASIAFGSAIGYGRPVRPSVLRYGESRLLFCSREERRMPLPVHLAAGEAKPWLAPRSGRAETYAPSRRRTRTRRR